MSLFCCHAEVSALTPDEFEAAESRVLAFVRAAGAQSERFLSKMTRNRAAAVRLGVPLHGVADNEETRALFSSIDTNGNGTSVPKSWLYEPHIERVCAMPSTRFHRSRRSASAGCGTVAGRTLGRCFVALDV